MPDAECALCGKVGKIAKWAKEQSGQRSKVGKGATWTKEQSGQRSGHREKWAKDQNDPLCIFHDCVLVAVGKAGKGDELRSAKGGKLLCHSLAPKVF